MHPPLNSCYRRKAADIAPEEQRRYNPRMSRRAEWSVLSITGWLATAALLALSACNDKPQVQAEQQPGLFGNSTQTATPFGSPQQASRPRTDGSTAPLAPPPMVQEPQALQDTDAAEPEFKPRKAERAQRPPQPLYAFACGAEPIEVRDPLDPANPYRGQYAPHDIWIYVEAWENAQGQPTHYGQQGAQAGEWYSMAVDEDGWPVPLKVEEELYYGGKAREVCRRAISTFGFMGTTLEELRQRDELAVKARYLPTVPEWLAQRAQSSAMILPGGEVVSRGSLSSTDAPDSSDHKRYYRYSADGEELGTASGRYWWQLYWPDFGETEARYPDSRWLEFDGYITRYEQDNGTPRETWDYKGKRFKGTAPPSAPGNFEWLSAESLRELYSLQSGDPHFSIGAQGA